MFDTFLPFHTSDIEILEFNAHHFASGMTSGRLQRRSKMKSQKSRFFDHRSWIETLNCFKLFPQPMDRAEVVHAPSYNIELSWKNITSENEQVLSWEISTFPKKNVHIVCVWIATQHARWPIEYYSPRGQAVSTSHVRPQLPHNMPVGP